MGLITDTTLDTLRAIPIREVAERLGIELGQGRANARCFNKDQHAHGDKNGSLGFDERTNLFKCFGCGVSGDTIRLVELVENVEFREACDYLANNFGVKLDTEISKNKRTTERPAPNFNRKSPYADYNEPIRLNEHYEYDFPHSEIYQEFYNNTEPPNKALVNWWHKRGFSDELLEAYGWRMITSKTYTQTLKRYSEQELVKSGILRLINGELRQIFYAHTVVTPFFDNEVVDDKNKVLYLRARSLDPTQKAKYLAPKGTSPTIYGFDRLMRWAMIYPSAPPLYITESETDSIALTELARRQDKDITAIALVGGQKTENSLTVRELTHILTALDKAVEVNIVTDRDNTGEVFFNAVATALYKQGFNPKNLIKWQEWSKQAKDVGEHLQRLTEQQSNRTAKQGNRIKNKKDLK